MKKEAAINILNKQKDKLDDVNNLVNDTWRTQTVSYIKMLFGETSPEYSFIYHFQMYYDYDTKVDETKGRIPQLSKYIDNCIETINDKGLYREQKKNFLSRLPDTWPIPILSIAIPSLFIGGTLWGKKLSDTQNIELKMENKDLKSRLPKVFSIPQNANNVISSETQSDTASNNKGNKIQDK
jgi:hypothetical protein